MLKKLTCGLVAAQAFLMNAGVYAQDAIEAVPTRDGSLTQTMIMIGIALVFFYFILWRPEQKRRKLAELRRNSLKKGDRVTAVGIVGTVASLLDDTVVLKMYDGSKIEVLKGAITEVHAGPKEDLEKVEKEDANDCSTKR